VSNIDFRNLDEDLLQHLITECRYFENPDYLIRHLFYVQVLNELGVALTMLERTRTYLRRLLALIEQCDAYVEQ
jgi:hypothetical protein